MKYTLSFQYFGSNDIRYITKIDLAEIKTKFWLENTIQNIVFTNLKLIRYGLILCKDPINYGQEGIYKITCKT